MRKLPFNDFYWVYIFSGKKSMKSDDSEVCGLSRLTEAGFLEGMDVAVKLFCCILFLYRKHHKWKNPSPMSENQKT